MLKKASGESGGGLLTGALGWLSSLAWPVKFVVLPVLLAMIPVFVEYGVIKPVWDDDGPHEAWHVRPTAKVQGTSADGEYWVDAQRKVHVTGVLEDVAGDSASAEVGFVQSPPSWPERTTTLSEGAGQRGFIGVSGAGYVFDSDTSKVEVVACTHDRSPPRPPVCGPPQVIYDAVKYRERDH